MKWFFKEKEVQRENVLLKARIRELEGLLARVNSPASPAKATEYDAAAECLSKRGGVRHLKDEVKEGMFARDCQHRCHVSNITKTEKGKYVRHLKNGKHHQKKKVTDGQQEELIAMYMRFSLLGEAMKVCSKMVWKDSMYTSAAKCLIDLPVPRLTLDALKQKLEGSSMPVNVIIDVADGGPSTTPQIGYDSFEKVAWCNDAYLKWWGFKSLEECQAFHSRGIKEVRYVRNTINGILGSVFEDGDVQPKRNMYYKYGSGGAGVYSSATSHIMQNSVILIEAEGKVHVGLTFELDAPKKYQKEIANITLRSHALFKYTENAMTIFTPCGAIVQQNPVSMNYLGMAATENVIYTDFNRGGKPVNRLRALFGENEALYDEMWAALKKDDIWNKKKMKVFNRNLKPFVCNRDLMEANLTDQGIWVDMQVIQFVDPSDGRKAIFVMFKDITKAVGQEERVRQAKKHEHEILESIIPAHIIDILMEEKRSVTSSFKSNGSFESGSSSERFLSLSAIHSRANNLAEHHANVTISFADVVGFTEMSSQCTPAQTMTLLNRLFTMFDDYTEEHGIYKVETIGDSYMCVAGLNLNSKRGKQICEEAAESHAIQDAQCMLAFARDILNNLEDIGSPVEGQLQIRVGMHSGECMTGIVGYKMPRFCLFGDTVNTASRMESTGKPGYIHASNTTRDLLPDEPWVATGGIDAKGKGLVETFTLEP